MLCTLPKVSFAQVSPQERLFADRVAILALNDKCHIFDDGEKRALYAFMMQARGNLLKMGTEAVSYTHLDVYKRQGYQEG